MAGFHNITIYTLADNPWCMKCLNSELIFGERNFNGGGFVCPPKAIPTAENCSKFVAASAKTVWRRRVMVKFMLGRLNG